MIEFEHLDRNFQDSSRRSGFSQPVLIQTSSWSRLSLDTKFPVINQALELLKCSPVCKKSFVTIMFKKKPIKYLQISFNLLELVIFILNIMLPRNYNAYHFREL